MSVLMNAITDVAPKAIQDLLDELGIIKAKPVARLECLAETSIGSF
jgi:hypothetical protein